MLIRSVETFPLKVTANEPYLGRTPDGSAPASGYSVRPPYRSIYSSRYETLLVRVTAENGTTGWGEALAPVAPEVPAAIVDLLLAPTLRGMDATQPRQAWHVLRNLMRERGHLVGHQADALAAVDIALWDLAGKLSGRNVSAFTGGTIRTSIPTYVSGLPRSTDPERAELAREWESKGAKAVKLHLGNGVDDDLATVRAVREAAPTLRVAVDAHWIYSLSDACRLADGLADLDAWFLEAPLAPEDVAGHAALVARSRLPVAVGEALRNRYEFGQWLDAGALSIAQPDIARTGITEGLIIAELAAARHVRVAPHHSTGFSVALAAGLQVSAAIEDLAVFEYQPTSTEIGTQILRAPLSLRADAFTVPSGPGLGVDVDDAAIVRLAKES